MTGSGVQLLLTWGASHEQCIISGLGWPPLDCHMIVHRTNQSQTSAFLQFLHCHIKTLNRGNSMHIFSSTGNTNSNFPLSFDFPVVTLNRDCFHFAHAHKSPRHSSFQQWTMNLGLIVKSIFDGGYYLLS